MFERRASVNALHEGRKKSGSDRRITQRYEAGGTPVVFTWREMEEYRTIEGRLQDISLGGVAALTPESPPHGVPIWFRLRDDDRSAWIPAWVVGNARSGLFGLGPRVLRVRFHEACPYDVFKAAIEGFTQESLDPEFSRSGLKDRAF
jgi:hypothetical protein